MFSSFESTVVRLGTSNQPSSIITLCNKICKGILFPKNVIKLHINSVHSEIIVQDELVLLTYIINNIVVVPRP